MTGPSIADTRLDRAAYLEHWHHDLARIVELAPRGLSLPIPTCPGWTGTDLIQHLSTVYWSRAMTVELGRFITSEERRAAREARDTSDPVVDMTAGAAALEALLNERRDDDWSQTFIPSEETIGFWYRRMALETLVHRSDLELACGELTPMSPALCLDGVDELVGFLSSGTWDEPIEGASGQVVRLRADAVTWTVQLTEPGLVLVSNEVTQDADVEATASEMLSWASGRDGSVTITGDRGAAELLHGAFATF